MDCRNCKNEKCIIRQHCLSEWLDYVQRVKTPTHLYERKRIFSEGDLVHGLYIVCTGKIMLSMAIDDKHDDIVRLAGEGQILGHRGFYDDMTYPVSADTITPSELAFIPIEDFIKLVRKNSDFALFLISFYASELLHSDRKLQLQISGSDREKALYALQRVYEAFADKKAEDLWLELGLDLEKLANFASLSPEDFVEILDEFKAESKLVLEGDQIHVLDVDFFRKSIN
ncbi:MAG: hypothetical protein DRI84_08050 [Bacteroidetes bacterium]|nr:MAG: hypothetical protein DRI84_08050 [Bacteroidota bacterium]